MQLYHNFSLETQELYELQQLELMTERTLEGATYYRDYLQQLMQEWKKFRCDPDRFDLIQSEYLSKVLLLQKKVSAYWEGETERNQPIDYKKFLQLIQSLP